MKITLDPYMLCTKVPLLELPRVVADLGPSSWDGYAAAVASDAGVEALRTGNRVEVALVERPKLYLPPEGTTL